MREKENFNLAAAICAAVSLLLLLFPTSGFVYAARAVLVYSLYPSIYTGHNADVLAKGIPHNIKNLLDADRRSRDLEEKIRGLQIQIEELSSKSGEVDRLRAEMQLAKSSKWKGKWASVSSRDSHNWYGFLTIDKGSEDGIYVNDTVMALNGGRAAIVGRVYETSPHFSRIMLAGNRAFSIIVSIGMGGKEVLAEGTGQAKMNIEYLPFGLSVEEGQEVFSAPSASLYVSNVRIGSISKSYKRDSEASFSSAEISLEADMDNLKELYVIRHELPEDLVLPSEENKAL